MLPFVLTEVKSGLAVWQSGIELDSSGSQVLVQGQSPRLMSIDKDWASAFKPNSVLKGESLAVT